MPTITRLDDVPPFTLGLAQFYPLSSPRLGGTELAVWQLRLRPGPVSAAHTIDREEVFVCLSGELQLTVNGELFRLATGDTLAVPAGSRLAAGAGDGEAQNPRPVVALVCTRAGLSATMADGMILTPPWAA